MLRTKGWSSEVSDNIGKQFNKYLQHKRFSFLCYQFFETQWHRKTTFTNTESGQIFTPEFLVKFLVNKAEANWYQFCHIHF